MSTIAAVMYHNPVRNEDQLVSIQEGDAFWKYYLVLEHDGIADDGFDNDGRAATAVGFMELPHAAVSLVQTVRVRTFGTNKAAVAQAQALANELIKTAL